jgi:hypothetical protein
MDLAADAIGGHGYGPARIEPGFDPAMKAAFEGLRLADMLH